MKMSDKKISETICFSESEYILIKNYLNKDSEDISVGESMKKFVLSEIEKSENYNLNKKTATIKNELVVYTDGSCMKNPGSGGWGDVIPGGWCAVILRNFRMHNISGHETNTNARDIKIIPVIKALEEIEKLPEFVENKKIKIFTISAYLYEVINHWIPELKQKNWVMTKNGYNFIYNKELFQKLDSYIKKIECILLGSNSKDKYIKYVGNIAKKEAEARQEAKQSEKDTQSHNIVINENELVVYTDGSCIKNPGPGGWGVVIIGKNEENSISGYELYTTNNRMELIAVIKALEEIEKINNKNEKIKIFTDSRYVQNGITQWIKNWKKNNWITSDKNPVKNKDLWLMLDSYNAKNNIEWVWVKAHNNDKYNEQADVLAKTAAKQADTLARIAAEKCI